MPGSGSADFDKLKAHLETNDNVRREVEFAFASLLAQANPSDRGARFVFGGGAEWIMASASWSAGILTAPAGHNANGFDLGDLLDKSRSLWSVKASASAKSGQIRLVNFLGGGLNRTWDEPTLFISPYLGGAVLIDPTQDNEVKERARRVADALILPGGVPKRYAAEHPENHIAFKVEVNQGAGQSDQFAFIRNLLDPAHFPILAKPFLAAAPKPSSNRVEEIQQLVTLRDQGVLNEDQFKKAVDQVIG